LFPVAPNLYAFAGGEKGPVILPVFKAVLSGPQLPRSWFGKFAVAAKKEDEDYPDMSNQFYSGGKFETVTLTSGHPNRTVTVRLGPKAGVLLGAVTDAMSNAPLSPCVEFRRVAEPSNYLSASGWSNRDTNYSFLLTQKSW
jgi:hypothetical protein